MWGIKPKIAGFKVAEIKPQLADLTFSKIQVPTKNGVIIATFKKDNNAHNYTITIPNNMTAEFTVPPNFMLIEFNGKKLKSTNNLIHLKSGNHTIKLKH
jgi:hypothetical protein